MAVRWSAVLVLVLAAAAHAAPAPRSVVPRVTVCGCLSNKTCRSTLEQTFGMVYSAKKTEIEGALPGRFFPGTLAWAMPEPDKDGHFLTVECGANRVPCRDRAETLERRLLAVSLLSALPLPPPPTDYYDPRTWEVKPAGVAALAEARRCRPELWDELVEPLHVRVPD